MKEWLLNGFATVSAGAISGNNNMSSIFGGNKNGLRPIYNCDCSQSKFLGKIIISSFSFFFSAFSGFQRIVFVLHYNGISLKSESLYGCFCT